MVGPASPPAFWAMPVLVALPLWAYIYQGTLSPPPAGEGSETRGAELFSEVGCSGCHGAGGGGSGSFPGFTDGRIFETFPAWPTHFEWVRLGSAGWLDERTAALELDELRIKAKPKQAIPALQPRAAE